MIRLAPFARKVLDHGAATGGFLEHGLRALFRLFEEGVECTELHIAPLGGALFGTDTTPLLSSLEWGERAVAHLLDRLLWTQRRRGGDARERVHYGPLDVEDLGRVYEALLELEPGIAGEPMCRLRRQKLEVVVPVAQGEKYRTQTQRAADSGDEDEAEEKPEEDDTEDEAPRNRTKVEWVEAIQPGQFYLRVGLGRKTSGSFYTPHSFVRFLVQETLGPQVAERSPPEDPNPAAILKLKVLDPAMGSGHFLVEACRFLGEKLYEACRACDEKALSAERQAEAAAGKDDEAKFTAAAAEAERWRQRIADLPDPEDELLRYLPSRAPEGEESGLSQKKAEALCRRLVAVHCLYGVDKNPLAIELAKLSLWLESQAEGLPLTFLDHRLVLGDSLTGPFWDKLIFQPGTQQPIQDLFHQNLDKKFVGALREAIKYVDLLDASVGATLADLENKRRLKAELDRALVPFKVIAAAWSGGVMLGPGKCDDLAYSQLVRAVGETGDLPEELPPSARLWAMIARGLGLSEVPQSKDDLYRLAASGVTALPYDLAFPEVFFPNAEPFGRRGFDAVFGNPPWEAIQPKSKEFFAVFDIGILDAPTRRERQEIERRLLEGEECAVLFEAYKETFEERKRINDVLYKYQKIEIQGDLAGRQLDEFRVFMERDAALLCSSGITGVVVPSAFHANEGATGIRRLYLENMDLQCCYSFENRRKLFEIDSRFKFALVVASGTGPTPSFLCAFYLHDDEWLFGDTKGRLPLLYSLEFVRRTGGEYLSLMELRDGKAVETVERAFGSQVSFRSYCRDTIKFRMTELHMSHDAHRFTLSSGIVEQGDPRDPAIHSRLIGKGYGLLHEGKTYHQYSDRWGDRPRYVVRMDALQERPYLIDAGRYYRLAFRAIAASTNERTVIVCMLPPGSWCGHTSPVEELPAMRSNAKALSLAAMMNSYTFDFLARQRVAASVGLYMLESLPLPDSLSETNRLLAHTSLRLTCQHLGYRALWREQLGAAWREPGKEPLTWPVLATEEQRWEVRSAIDAVVADAYGLSREQYEHVLHSFDRASGSNPHRDTCLAKFDELKGIGLEAFTKKYDPYWDIPLVETLPKPVIDLPLPSEEPGGCQTTMGFGSEESGRGTRRRT
jgi:hypothetical protein